MVISAEGFKDIKGYTILIAKKIMNIMENAGIPYEADNKFGENPFLENMAANELVEIFLNLQNKYFNNVYLKIKVYTKLYK